MIVLTREPEDTPGWLALEHCCFCGAKTPFWFTPKDVAVCETCAPEHTPEEIPDKETWCKSPQGKGLMRAKAEGKVAEGHASIGD